MKEYHRPIHIGFDNRPKSEDKVTCPYCKWEGEFWELVDKSYNNLGLLSGSSGINYNCPNCHETIYQEVRIRA